MQRTGWLAVEGQRRSRPLSATLALARLVGARAGVTRLADVTGLDRIGIPVFQAVRPLSRTLSVSQGKGLTPMAAMVSALLEAVEFDAAERLMQRTDPVPLAVQNIDTVALWAGKVAGGIRLDRDRPRGWLPGRDLASGASVMLPLDLVGLDFVTSSAPDVMPSSVGLGAGNSSLEATIAAVAELVEHDLDAHWLALAPPAKRATGVDLDSIDAATPRRLLRRIAASGCTIRIWSLASDGGVAAFRCAIFDSGQEATALPPIGGTGCHPDRTTALLRAILEAVQGRVTLIAGARDDLGFGDYGDGAERNMALLFGAMSFGAGPLDWRAVPCHATSDIAADLDALLGDATRRSPVVAVELPAPVEGLSVVRALAPGLCDPDRGPRATPAGSRYPAVGRGTARALVFAGPSLAGCDIPDGIELRPPALCGDLAALLADPPAAVGLIDGCFEVGPTVWHKEIVDLLAAGVAVAGAASLGAIRAAELHDLGMVGIGKVFEAYRDGRVQRDDAVMVVHAPAELGHRPLSLALVDAEAALLAVDMPAAERRMLQRIIRTASFRTRDWNRCLAVFRMRTGASATVSAADLAAVPSVKQADARALVAVLAAGLSPPPARQRPPLTGYYRALPGTPP